MAVLRWRWAGRRVAPGMVMLKDRGRTRRAAVIETWSSNMAMGKKKKTSFIVEYNMKQHLNCLKLVIQRGSVPFPDFQFLIVLASLGFFQVGRHSNSADVSLPRRVP